MTLPRNLLTTTQLGWLTEMFLLLLAAGAPLVLTTGDELKLVYPQDGAPPEVYENLAFRHFFLQPMDGPERERNTALATRYCLAHPRWRLALQTHKLIGIP